MMKMDYDYFKKTRYRTVEDMKGLVEYDCLISTYVESERAKAPSQYIPCKEKWWVLEDDNDGGDFIGDARTFRITDESDGGIAKRLVEKGYNRLCIDITGFVIPQLLILLRFLQINGLRSFDVIYTEPNQYKEGEETQFTETPICVKQILGYSGMHISDMSNDLLIVAAGYDHSRIIEVATEKKSAKKVLLFGFPPCSPGMFQENILRAFQAEPAVGMDCFRNMDLNIFAAANDPFSTAQALKDYVDKVLRSKEPFTKLYLSPLSSKPQALGMALYYIWENGWKKEWSIIYPFCTKYIHDTTSGISRIWQYEIMLPEIGSI